jgi:ATP-dependent RNA helicase DeaD
MKEQTEQTSDASTEVLGTFNDLGLSTDILAAVAAKGFTTPSPIQAGVIPLLLMGKKDIIGQAQTGTGKTAAFALPLLDLIDPSKKEIQAIIMAPTRELAIQVAEEIQSFSVSHPATVQVIYGGNPMNKEIQGIKRNPTIIVGTPGRIHIRTNVLKLGTVKYFILDEADEMLNFGFRKEIESILALTPKQRRILLFSATMPKSILDIAKTHMKEYDIIKVAAKEMTNENITQKYFKVEKRERIDALTRIMAAEEKFYAIIFCRTRYETKKVAKKLQEQGFLAGAIHGDVDQKKRQKILGQFKEGSLQLLIATDVAARGIDVPDLNFVVNFTIPETFETYTHRIGRTGRAGNTGTAITFIAPDEAQKLRFFEKNLKVTMEQGAMPDAQMVLEKKRTRMIEKVEHIIDNEDISKAQDLAKMLLDEGTPQNVVAALLLAAYPADFGIKSKEVIKEQTEPQSKTRNNNYKQGRSRNSGGSSNRRDSGAPKFGGGRTGGSSQKRTPKKAGGNSKNLKSRKRGKDAYSK